MSDVADAVFLSYASEDAPAARRLCEALRAAGLEVWLDQSELRGGDAWDASIRRQIRDCRLFVPLISAATNTRSEGYFRLEWRLAVERSHLIADDQPFLVPVLIDDTPEATARVPDRFRERQWTRLQGGIPSPEFIAQLKRKLAAVPAAPATTPVSESRRAIARRHSIPWRVVGVVLSFATIAGVLALALRLGRDAKPAPPARPAAAAVAERKSIAVLPFDNLGGRAEDNYLADGLQEEVLNALARVRDLKVISRTSVMEFRGSARNVREIGRRLGVSTVLEGSIRRDGNKLRLTVQLIDARDDRHLLAANYDRELSRILDLQSAVARQIADALAATLTQHERGELQRVATNSGDAYNRYLQALALFQRAAPNDAAGLIEPRRLLEESLRFDPDYVDALALLSQTETLTYFSSHHRDDGAKALKSLERALAIDPQLPEALLARGLYAIYVSEDLDQALTDLTVVVRLRPSSARAHLTLAFALRRRGHAAEALAYFERAWDLDPLNQIYATPLIATLGGLRRYPEAIEQCKLYSRRFPNDYYGLLARAWFEGFMQRSPEPLRALLRDHGAMFDPPDRMGVEADIAVNEGRYLDAVRLAEKIPDSGDPLWREEVIGFWYLAAGDTRRAGQTFRSAERHGHEQLKRDPANTDVLVHLAMVESMLGKHPAALATIERARTLTPEARDANNGPGVSFVRSVILVRAGRRDEGYAEVARLAHVPFGAPAPLYDDKYPMLLLLKDDPHYDALVNHSPRL